MQYFGGRGPTRWRLSAEGRGTQTPLSEMVSHEEDDIIRSSRSQMFSKIGALKNSQNSQENACVGVCFWLSCWALGLQLYSKETPRQVFSCVYIVKILSTPFFYRTPLVAAFLSSYCFLVRKFFLLEEILLWLFRWRFL